MYGKTTVYKEALAEEGGLCSERPNLDDTVAPAGDHVAVHVPEPLSGRTVAIGNQRRMLFARAVVNLRSV